MAVTILNTQRVIATQAKYLHMTVYTDRDSIGSVTYGLPDIVADSLSLIAEDNEITEIEGEFVSEPLHESVIPGKYTFQANNLNFAPEFFSAFMGWEKDETTGDVYAPALYKEVYVVAEIGFENEDIVLVLPKLKLNSKANLENLKSGTGLINLAGTAYSMEVTKDNNTRNAPYIIMNSTNENPAEYTIAGVKFKAGDGVQDTTTGA